MFYIKSLKNAGFTLVEILVAAGLLGGLSLVLINLNKQTSQSTSKFQFDTEIQLITNEINGSLSDPNKCLTTFTNATQASTSNPPILNSTPENVLNPTGIASIPSSVRKFTLSGGPYGNGQVIIVDYSLNLGATPDPLLTINFKKKAIMGTGTVSKTIRLYAETVSGIITKCRSLSSASTDIWSRGTSANIYYNGGNVGIGTSTPQLALEVNGSIRPGSGGVAIGGPCSVEGAFAYDALAHVPVYCNQSNQWSSMNGGGISYDPADTIDINRVGQGWTMAECPLNYVATAARVSNSDNWTLRCRRLK